jgi:hypothetical protein
MVYMLVDDMREKGGIEVGAAFLCRFGVKSDSAEFERTLLFSIALQSIGVPWLFLPERRAPFRSGSICAGLRSFQLRDNPELRKFI